MKKKKRKEKNSNMYNAKHGRDWESKDLIWYLILREQNGQGRKKRRRRRREEKRSSKKIKGMESCILLDFGRNLYGFKT